MRRGRRQGGGDAAEVGSCCCCCCCCCCCLSLVAAAATPTCAGRYIALHGQPLATVGGGAAAGGEEAGWAEEFEADEDRHWQRYARCMERDAEQAVRYSWGGRVLWPRAPPAPPPCPLCAAPRVFECQFMPPLLRLLNVDALALAVCVNRFLHCIFVTLAAGIAAATAARRLRGYWHTRCRVMTPLTKAL
jgi:hypothetical protein